MFISQETRERTAFIENSIGSSHNRFVDDPHMQGRLGTFATYLARLTERMFIPNIRGGEVRIPRKYREEGVAVLARGANDPLLFLGSDFGILTTQQKQYATSTLEAWSQHDPERRIHNIEKVSRIKTAADKPLAGATLLRPNGHRGATTLSVTQNIVMRDRHLRLRPLVSFPYDGPNTLPVSPAVVAHHAMHVHQSEVATLGTIITGEQRSRQNTRWELEADAIGAMAAHAMLDAGLRPGALTHEEEQQLVASRTRHMLNQQNPDKFDPRHEVLQRTVRLDGIDFWDAVPAPPPTAV